MTREEAKSELMQIYMSLSEEKKQALDLAIQALEYDDVKYHEEHGEVVVDKAVWEDAKKALEQEPCEDAVSRHSAIFLANDLKQDLPDDERIADMVMAHNEGILEYQTQLSLLPPITPQPKTVHWIVHEHAEEFYGRVVDNYECDNCGDWYLNKTNFCPNCGAKMLRIPIGSESEVEE